MSTDGLGWLVVKPQQLHDRVQDRPGVKRFISFAAMITHQPEHILCSLFVPQEVLFQ